MSRVTTLLSAKAVTILLVISVFIGAVSDTRAQHAAVSTLIPTAPKPIPVLLDTDIGGDVDDALALALLLQSPEFDLRGITTVHGNSALARQVIGHYGAKTTAAVPVVSGTTKPLGRAWDKSAEAARPSDAGAAAVQLLANEIQKGRSAGGRLTVLAIGPLTNIALLLTRHPELTGAFDLVLMGGYWGNDRDKPEWNINCDPEAAAVVFQSGVSLTMVGLDVTRRCILSDEQVALFAQGSARAKFLDGQIKRWGRKVVLHDPLTILALCSPCVTFAPKRIEVPLAGEKRACTLAVDGLPNARVAVDVDADAVKTLFLERVVK